LASIVRGGRAAKRLALLNSSNFRRGEEKKSELWVLQAMEEKKNCLCNRREKRNQNQQVCGFTGKRKGHTRGSAHYIELLGKGEKKGLPPTTKAEGDTRNEKGKKGKGDYLLPLLTGRKGEGKKGGGEGGLANVQSPQQDRPQQWGQEGSAVHFIISPPCAARGEGGGGERKNGPIHRK